MCHAITFALVELSQCCLDHICWGRGRRGGGPKQCMICDHTCWGGGSQTVWVGPHMLGEGRLKQCNVCQQLWITLYDIL